MKDEGPMTVDEGAVQTIDGDAAEVVAALLRPRDWRLVAADELVRRALALRAAGFVGPLPAAALHLYAEVLYQTCRGGEGRARQERGFIELHRYLHDLTLRFGPDLTDDERAEVANVAVAELFYRLTDAAPSAAPPVRQPGAFLAVAIQQLRNVIRRWRSTRLPTDDAALALVEADSAADPAARLVTTDLARRVRQCYAGALRRYPRARLQLAAVWAREVDGLDYPAMADRLAISVPNARALYSRGMDRLRHDPEWQALGREAGLATAVAALRSAQRRATLEGSLVHEPVHRA